MMKSAAARAAALSLVLMLACSAAAQESITNKVDQVFSHWNNTNSPGCALAVVKDGKIAYEHGYGMANLELGIAISPHSIFDIGSVSKQFTAMAIVLLQHEGKLSLDDDIRKYLPEMPDYGSKITIRNMLHHTSGLRNYDDLFDLVGVPEADLTTDRDALELTARQKGLNFKPGEEFLYSDTNFFLMSLIVKRVTGESLRQFAQERIFGPLHMTSTHFHDDHTMIVPQRATGYAPHPGGGFEMDMSNFEQLGDGSVMTTVEDLYKWDQNFYNPIVGGPEAIRELTTPGTLNNGERIPYAMGMFIDRYRGLKWIHHSGEWVGYRAALSRFPEQHFSTIVTCNCIGTMNPMGMATRVADIYLAGQFRDNKKTAAGNSSPAEQNLAQYAGAYWSAKTGAFRRFSVENGQLIMTGPDIPFAMVPVGKGVFEYRSGDSENKGRYTFQRANLDSPYRLEVFEPGRAPDNYQAVGPAPTRDRLFDYAGTYSNDELRSTWKLVVKDGKLIRQQWVNEDQELQPAFADGFIGDLSEGQYVLHFNRDARGRVTSFNVSTDMVYPMKFVKSEEAGCPCR